MLLVYLFLILLLTSNNGVINYLYILMYNFTCLTMNINISILNYEHFSKVLGALNTLFIYTTYLQQVV